MERLLTLYSEVQSTDVRWLWYPFIAIGKITLLQGDPGDGKSTMSLTGEECRHEFWTSYEPASDNSGGKPENECWERCYPYSWKSGLYLRFAEERSEVYCNHAVCCGASHVL